MPTRPMNHVLQRLRQDMAPERHADLTDAQLLDRFIAVRDDMAFAAIVRRHGPMVWSVCRRIAGQHQDAEDAFQAAFLVLSRKPGAIRPRSMLAGWLHGVACHTALKARTQAHKRREREKQVIDMPEPEARAEGDWNDLKPLLDRAIDELPVKYRTAIILCDLEGQPRQDAARQLGVPEGTLSAQLTRGRRLLTDRLRRRGVTLPAGVLAAIIGREAVAGDLPAATFSAVLSYHGMLASTGVPARVLQLTEGVLQTMLLRKLKLTTAILCLVGLAGYGIGVVIIPALAAPVQNAGPGDKSPPGVVAKDPPKVGPAVQEGAVPPKIEYGDWSKESAGVQGRLLQQRRSSPGIADVIAVTVEIKNVSGLPKFVEIERCTWAWQLLDAKGKPVAESHLPRSGPLLEPKAFTLPPGMYMGFSVYAGNVGVPPKGTLVPLIPGSHDWVLPPGEYTLQAELGCPPYKDAPKDAWLGHFDFPAIKILAK